MCLPHAGQTPFRGERAKSHRKRPGLQALPWRIPASRISQVYSSELITLRGPPILKCFGPWDGSTLRGKNSQEAMSGKAENLLVLRERTNRGGYRSHHFSFPSHRRGDVPPLVTPGKAGTDGAEGSMGCEGVCVVYLRWGESTPPTLTDSPHHLPQALPITAEDGSAQRAWRPLSFHMSWPCTGTWAPEGNSSSPQTALPGLLSSVTEEVSVQYLNENNLASCPSSLETPYMGIGVGFWRSGERGHALGAVRKLEAESLCWEKALRPSSS